MLLGNRENLGNWDNLGNWGNWFNRVIGVIGAPSVIGVNWVLGNWDNWGNFKCG